MKRLFAILPLALAACYQTPHIYTNTTYSELQTCLSTQYCNGSAPFFYTDGGASAGALLAGADSFQLLVSAWNSDAGAANGTAGAQQFLDGGYFAAYLCSFTSQLCHRDQQLDQPMILSGQAAVAFPQFKAADISEDADTVEFVATNISVNGVDAGPINVRILTHNERYK